jgi:uncharacterized protein (DUF1499 family)
MLQSSSWKRPGWHALGPILTTLGVLLLVLSPVGYRLGWFGVPTALLRLIPLALAACVLGLAASLVAIARTAPGAGAAAWILPLACVAISIAASVVPVLGIVHARQVPRIHDITTDTAAPPSFVALAAQRSAAPNGLEYGGPAVASEQKRAYPDLATLHSPLAPQALFERAQQAARECGWQLADANRSDGRIEAVDTSLLYGFKDDIVVRIRADPGGGSLVDVRSASRVGRSDLGANAARIRRYLRLLEKEQSA